VKFTPVSEDVSMIVLPPRRFVNAYLLGDVLVDAGLPIHGRGVVKALAGRSVATHLITHAHGDHAGGSRAVADALNIPVWCSAGDAEAIRAGKPAAASRVQAIFRWNPVEVARELREGDEVGSGFTVLDAAGHSPGQIALWRERDRTLICADVFLNLHFYTTLPGLSEPPSLFNWDPSRNRDCARRLAELEPRLVLFGHGQPLRDPAKLRAFAQGLPRG
jgi:glyoxylase-like metal-dependent hydrolase (beta-lactamase superfamily II)